MAEQEVIFGAPGQTLRLRHDTVGRECYLPGVLLAVRKVVGMKGLIFGLQDLHILKQLAPWLPSILFCKPLLNNRYAELR